MAQLRAREEEERGAIAAAQARAAAEERAASLDRERAEREAAALELALERERAEAVAREKVAASEEAALLVRERRAQRNDAERRVARASRQARWGPRLRVGGMAAGVAALAIGAWMLARMPGPAPSAFAPASGPQLRLDYRLDTARLAHRAT